MMASKAAVLTLSGIYFNAKAMGTDLHHRKALSVLNFDLVGQGMCMDASGVSFAMTHVQLTAGDIIDDDDAGNGPDYKDCISWCLQNPHADLVGVSWAPIPSRGSGGDNAGCFCCFSVDGSDQPPASISLSDYAPNGLSVIPGQGSGTALNVGWSNDHLCYANNNYVDPGRPSSQPSSMPSNQPSDEPSESPTGMPSKSIQPSMPTCIVTEAPTSSPSTPASSSSQPTSSYKYWYPDWAGRSETCLNDDNMPSYMTQYGFIYIFTSKQDCCNKYYSTRLSKCMGLNSGTRWYPDWTSGDDTCKNDGRAESYMIDNGGLYLHDDQSLCCVKYFNYKINSCLGTPSFCNSKRFFPDWHGGNEGCTDTATTDAPDYMYQFGGMYLYDTLERCCQQHYWYNVTNCMGIDPNGTGMWYVDWSTFRCVRDCHEGGPDCGGLASGFGRVNLHVAKDQCCQTHISYDYDHCMS